MEDSYGFQDDFGNPTWAYPNYLDGYSQGSLDAIGAEEPTETISRESTTSLTGSDTQQGEDGSRKGSKRGSKTSTPRSNGVVSEFVLGGEDGAARADSAMTSRPLTQGTPGPEDNRATPTTPRSAVKRDSKTLLSPTSATTFDRKALLSAKGAKAKGDASTSNNLDKDEEESKKGGRSFYDNLYRTQDRAEASIKRRKIEVDEALEEARKKSKQEVEISGGSGVMADFIKDEKAKDLQGVQDADGIANAIQIDLTGSVDEPVNPDDDSIVVLGRLERDGGVSPQALMNHVPHLKPKAMLRPSKTRWPPISVRLVHEDHFLIRLVDSQRQRFGTLDAQTAQAIVTLMTSNIGIQFKATLESRDRRPDEVEGDQVSQMAKLNIKVLAPKNRAKVIGKHLSQRKVWLRDLPVGYSEMLYNPHDPRTFTPKPSSTLTNGTSHNGILSSNSRTVEEIRTDVMNMFDSIIKTEHLPEAEQPANIKTELLAHQKQGLFFLTAREEDRLIPKADGGDVFHLWKPKFEANGRKVYYNVITGTEMSSKPPLNRGGMLADMMGLGKTLSMLSLIVQSADESHRFTKLKPPVFLDPNLRINSRATLLVCPLSVVANWEIQIKDHVREGALKTTVFHGANRVQKFEELANHDLVITSYHTISSEARSGRSPLFKIHWFRIVLDEAHIIRNPATAMAQATCAISAERRWVVTGTPVQNRLDDLGSLIKFLRIKPFDEKSAFAQYILAPFKTADPEILPKLRLLVDSITLRRLKDNIDLPARHDLIVKLEFSPEELQLYKIFVQDSKSKVQLLTNNERLGGRSYAQVLKAITRLRLLCAHGEEMLSDEDRKILEGKTNDKAIDLTDEDGDEDETPKINRKQAFDMLELLKVSSQDTCARCNAKIGAEQDSDSDSEDDEVRANTNTIAHMTSCFHLICPKCWPEHNAEVEQKISDEMAEMFAAGLDEPRVDEYNCSYCLQNTKFAHYEFLQSEIDAEAEEKRRIRANPKLARQMGFYKGPHTKTKQLVEYLKQFEAESHSKPREPPIKSVIFSTWTTHLDLIQIALTANGITYTRLDGTMSRKNRAAAIEDFTNNPEITCILVTIGAGGLGLNLTAGNKVFVMEPQFNPAAEQQAVDRVHRLGQTREVTIMRFIMHDSFEENMLRQQEKKVELADLAVNRNKKMDRAEAAKAKLESLRSLFR